MKTARFLDQLPQIVRKNLLPIVFAIFGLIFLVYGLIYLLGSAEQTPKDEGIIFERSEQNSPETASEKIIVNVAGSVVNPGVYEMDRDSRVKDALQKAGGFSKDADTQWVEKKLNLAAKISDAAKIYIPAVGEQESATAVLGLSEANSLQGPSSQNQAPNGAWQDGSININSASQDQLETLPGIGPVTAQKIIDNRPYSHVQDLITKKVVGEKTFGKIKEQIIAE